METSAEEERRFHSLAELLVIKTKCRTMGKNSRSNIIVSSHVEKSHLYIRNLARVILRCKRLSAHRHEYLLSGRDADHQAKIMKNINSTPLQGICSVVLAFI